MLIVFVFLFEGFFRERENVILFLFSLVSVFYILEIILKFIEGDRNDSSCGVVEVEMRLY